MIKVNCMRRAQGFSLIELLIVVAIILIIASGSKGGYTFFAAGFTSGAATTNIEFVSSSAPNTYNSTGIRNFCIVTDGVLRIDPGPTVIAPDVPTCLAYVGAQ